MVEGTMVKADWNDLVAMFEMKVVSRHLILQKLPKIHLAHSGTVRVQHCGHISSTRSTAVWGWCKLLCLLLHQE